MVVLKVRTHERARRVEQVHAQVVDDEALRLAAGGAIGAPPRVFP